MAFSLFLATRCCRSSRVSVNGRRMNLQNDRRWKLNNEMLGLGSDLIEKKWNRQLRKIESIRPAAALIRLSACRHLRELSVDQFLAPDITFSDFKLSLC